ncbi:MAG TPA: nuclear transport factor 2 family protein [Longimicrobiales bacterium]|nr:nuclear transport factor 2 family protein [Longimicrobiales bacterium]
MSVSLRTCPLLVLALLVSAPVPGTAQIRPGIERRDYWGQVRAEYRSETLERIGPLMDAWLSNWLRGNEDASAVDAMVREFSEDGVLILGGITFSGRDGLREALSQERQTGVEQSLSDFDVRGDMAFALGRLRHNGGTDPALVDDPPELVIWLFVKEGSDWRIRSLVLDGGS